MTSIEADPSQTPVSPGRPALPHAFFLDAPDGSQRFCLFHKPQPGIPERGRVLFCHPFAEELNTTRRTVARQARALAEAGFAVLQIDLLGCGDSSGDFADATWPIWLADLQRAHAWLSDQQRNPGGPLWLWGLRAGALLASDLAATLPEPTNLLLWQPFTSGQQQLQQFLRLHTAGQWLAGDKADAVKKTNTPAQQLAQGDLVHIAGYPLSPLLAEGLAAARLQPPAKQPPGRLIWLELGSQTSLSPATEKQLAAWQQAGWQATAQIVSTPAFWQTVETDAAPGLIPATLAALTVTQASADTAKHGSNATLPAAPVEQPGAVDMPSP
jgi:exosortase A-associated hydrolase 2